VSPSAIVLASIDCHRKCERTIAPRLLRVESPIKVLQPPVSGGPRTSSVTDGGRYFVAGSSKATSWRNHIGEHQARQDLVIDMISKTARPSSATPATPELP